MLTTTIKAVGNRMMTVLRRKTAAARLASRIHPLTVPLDPDEDAGWKPYHQFQGSTDNSDFLSCHVSVLIQGHCPHPPHSHPEEELLLMLAGEADLILPQLPSAAGTAGLRLRPGQFVYYPAHFPHTLRAVSMEPANYVMFKWLARSRATDDQLPFGHFDAGDSCFRGTHLPEFDYRPLFEGPTACLETLHAHATRLAPGAGHEPHTHAYEAAVVVLDGEIETLGRRVRPCGVVYYSGGELHNIRNPSAEHARYVVFEFHGHVPFWRKVTDPQRWRHKLRAMCRLQ
jgi:quercetin dioxygenase-like cupin family protein